MRCALVVCLAVIAAPVAHAAPVRPLRPLRLTTATRFLYRAHDGRRRPCWLLLPRGYDGGPIPLVISPHGRGQSARENARLWGDLPGEGGFAVVNPGGEGRRLRDYSWGARGQIDDLARMPEIARSHGVDVDRRRIYAVGGSMGGQETLLLVALHPHLIAGAAAFDPATDMRKRYYDFRLLRHGRELQQLAREEMGGTPAEVPAAYAARSPAAYVRQIAFSGVPLQLYWSLRDRVISDQLSETGALADAIERDNGHAKVWDFEGEWQHTAEMRASRRLPRALVRMGLLPWRDVPALPAPVTPVPAQPV
jgi:pimeloyl-ACP methyl ester carboxylesterase